MPSAIDESVSDRVILLLVIYGPSALGFAALLAICIFSHRRLLLALAIIGAVLLHLLTAVLMLGLTPAGRWGPDGPSDFAEKLLIAGWIGIAVLSLAKGFIMGFPPQTKGSSNPSPEKRDPPARALNRFGQTNRSAPTARR